VSLYVVVGAGPVGREMARLAAEEGRDVVLTSRRAGSIQAGSVRTVSADATDPSQLAVTGVTDHRRRRFCRRQRLPVLVVGARAVRRGPELGQLFRFDRKTLQDRKGRCLDDLGKHSLGKVPDDRRGDSRLIDTLER
jgi:NAD(P)-dependent dehydrogenase (short-subunit alcohol dehydrogenase family)